MQVQVMQVQVRKELSWEEQKRSYVPANLRWVGGS